MKYYYYFEKFKNNIFFIKFYINNKNNICKTFLIKISYIESNNSKEFYNNNIVTNTKHKNLFEKIIYQKVFRDFNLCDDLLIEINNIQNIDNNHKISFIINFDDLINTNIIKIGTIDFLLNNKKIDEITILIQEYNDNNKTLYHHLVLLNEFNSKIYIIENSINKLFIIHNELNLIHGDFKGNNILFNIHNKDISFIDLEFSIFLKEYELITIREIKLINYYLLLNDNYIISCQFLKLFDIFLFTLSFFISNKIDENHYFKYKLEDEINKKIFKKYNYSNYFILFFIIFLKIYKYFSIKQIYTYNIQKTFHNISSFESITNVLSEDISFENDSIINIPIINYNLEYINDIFKDLYNINNY
jgi:hypothetical protein